MYMPIDLVFILHNILFNFHKWLKLVLCGSKDKGNRLYPFILTETKRGSILTWILPRSIRLGFLERSYSTLPLIRSVKAPSRPLL